MTIVEPLPDLQWGKGSWQDYLSNWRTRDTNWLQERLILRYQTTAARNADWSAPQTGQVVYNDETKTVEMFSATRNTWVHALVNQYLSIAKDDSTGITLAHTGAGGKGLTLGPTAVGVLIDMPTNIMSGTALVDATGLSLKVASGATAKLSTDATNLVSSVPFKAPTLVGDALTVTGAATVGSITTPSLTVSGTLSITSGTISGGTLNGNSGTVNGVKLAITSAGSPAGVQSVEAPNGLVSQLGYFYGTGDRAIMRQRSAANALGAADVEVTATDIVLNGTNTYVENQLLIRDGRPIKYYNPANTGTPWNGGPVIVQTTDPGVANVPEGTIWCNA